MKLSYSMILGGLLSIIMVEFTYSSVVVITLTET